MIKSMTAVLFASSLLFSSCMKDHDDQPGTDTQVAGLMAFNLAPQQNAAGFALSGTALTNVPLSYTSFTGTYLGIYPGARTLEVYNPYTGSVIANSPGDFAAGKYYSAFLMGADSSYRSVVVADEVDSLSGTSGQAYVRYVNAIPDSLSTPTLRITAGGNSLVNGPARYGTVSGFSAVTPGDLSVSLNNEGNINVSRNIQVEARKIYTLLLVGRPGSGETPVSIKYVSNGTLSADSTARTSSTGRSVNVN